VGDFTRSAIFVSGDESMSADYRQIAAVLGRPRNKTTQMLAADAGKTDLATVSSTNYTLYIQKITFSPSTVAAQTITLRDDNGTPKPLGLIPASQATPYVVDFGPEGVALTAGCNLDASNVAGPAGIFQVEAYEKLSSVISYLAANQ
jgi:hypothetical protein